MSIKPKFNFIDNDLKVLDIKHRSLPKTKEEFVSEHRKMWKYISKQIAKYECIQNIADLKKEYIRSNFGFKAVKNDCFLCEYTSLFNSDDCRKCPLDNGVGSFCLGGLFFRVSYTKDWKEQADLAFQISSLPEVR